jgi:DNA-binding transcriptional LysR family regulator
MEWDDLRTVLALRRAGSLSGAARALGVSHSTVLRRLQALEAKLGVKLFEKRREGLLPRPAGEEMAALGEAMEEQVLGLERRLMGRDLRPSGSVRITTAEDLLQGLVAPLLPRLRETYPEIDLEIVASNARLNLTKRDADIAVRPTAEPPETLIGRRIGPVRFALYAATAYLDGTGPGRGIEPADHVWCGYDESLSHIGPARWLEAHLEGRPAKFRGSSVLAVTALVRAGAGIGPIPCYVGDQDPDLERLGPPIPVGDSELWVLTHRDLKAVARVRAVSDFLARGLGAKRKLLAGEAPRRTSAEPA